MNIAGIMLFMWFAFLILVLLGYDERQATMNEAVTFIATQIWFAVLTLRRK